MKKILLIVLFLLIPLVTADDYYNSNNLVINIAISSETTIKPTGDNYNIKHLIVNLSFFPRDSFNQEVLDISTTPVADIEDTIKFRWDNPTEKKLEFIVNADVKTNNEYIKIRKKIGFPIKELPDELRVYTEPSATVDSDNKDIVKLASGLAEGEDDLYVVVFKLAEWTKNNIEYDLSTLTATVSQKASWVLKTRQGVCDELTNLFIAMARSLGIPAKFISGIAYTDSPLFPEKWGPHGWAEVYLPGYRWVPFDVTYGEFGFIDPTHVKLKEALDADDPSTRYQWLGSNIDIETKKLEIETKIKERIGVISPFISLGVDVTKRETGFGSYNLVEVTVENLKDYYLSTELYLSKSREVDVIGKETRQILLKPRERKSIYWTVKLTEDLSKNYIYTFPVGISSLRNITANASFKGAVDNAVFSLAQIQEILDQKKEEELKVYSRNINLSCDISKREFYQYEDAAIACFLKNIGNVYLEDLRVCLEECEEFDLGIAQEKIINFSVDKNTVGKREAAIRAFNEQVSKVSYVEFILLDMPEIGVSSLEYPENVSFEDEYSISFTLAKLSWSSPKDIEIILKQNGFSREWKIDKLVKDEEFVINLQGNELGMENKFEILVKYRDNNKEYKTEKEFFIRLENVSFLQRMQIFLNKTAKLLIRLFK